MKHFYYYPKIDYSGNKAVNITVRGKIRDAILAKSALYYKYFVKEGERPDIISSKYYGNSSYTWAIFYANNMLDPQSEWPKEYSEFLNYLKAKYGSIENTTQTIHHYEYVDFYTKNVYIIDKATYDSYLGQYELETATLKEVRQVSVYDYENELNESKKNIVVLDKQYLLQITNELSNLFK